LPASRSLLFDQPRSLLLPQTAEVLAFGVIAALHDQASQLDLVDLIDAQLPKRDQGLSVGQYLLLATLNRAADPTSKAQLARWYRQTILTRLIPATLPARGHNKQKRGDLRQINLGMLVSTDFHVPLFHKVYTGNVNDSTAFQTISEELAHRYRQLAQGCEHITLIFDKGSNSAEAFETLDDSPFHFIGSLVPTQHADWLKIPLARFQPLSGERFAGCLAYRTRKEVFGHQRTVVLTYNEHLLEGQLQGINASLQMELLDGIQEVLLLYPRQPGQHEPRTATCLSTMDAGRSRSSPSLT
jgi:hypothetical protein